MVCVVGNLIYCVLFGCVDYEEVVVVTAGRLLSWSVYLFVFTRAGH